MCRVILTLLLTAGLLSTAPAVADARPIVAEDYYAITDIDDVKISPDGEQVIFVRTDVKEDKRGRNRNLWLASTEQALSARQLTRGNADHSPAWSPDGRFITFIGSRDEVNGLYKIRVAGGEARLLFKPEQGRLLSYKWAPDGLSLVFIISLDPDVESPLLEKEDEDDSPDIRTVERAVYKTQGRYLDNNTRSLWRYYPETDELAALTHDSGFHEGDIAFSANGTLAFASNRHEDAFEGAFGQSLFVIKDNETNELNTPEGHNGTPVWVNETVLAFVNRPAPYAAPVIYLYDVERQRATPLTGSLDLSPNNLTAESDALFFTADNHGSRTLHKVSLQDGELEMIAGEGYSLANLQVSPQGEHFIFTAEHEAKLIELYSYQAGERTALTQFNQRLQNELTLSRYEVFDVDDPAGLAAPAFFLPPLNRDIGASYPLILNIKGGPGGMWGHQWMQEMQLMAARGYAVLFINYAGSSGYGQSFAEQVRLDYGGADYRDNMLALDTALARYEWIDQDRLYVTGGSHGGFLTNWITTQTDRFRAAVTQRSVSNWISEAGTQAFPPASMRVEFGGTLWENFDYYWDRSPLNFADRVTTPTLIIHSTDDHITPIGQGEEWFYALKANNVHTRLVVFEGEGHGLSRTGTPVNLVERLRQIIDWFDDHS